VIFYGITGFQRRCFLINISHLNSHLDNNQMHKIKKKYVLSYVGLLFFWLSLLGCTTTPAPITEKSGDYDFAQLLETIRQKEKLPALAASVIINGNIYAKAAVGTREYGTDNWVTSDDKFLIGSCGKAFTATLAAILIEEGYLKWDTTLRDVFPDLEMHPKWENITIQQLLSNRSGYADDNKTGVLPLEDIEDFWNLNKPPMDLRFIYLKRAINHKPSHPPDRVIIYANTGFLIAGVMLEKLKKQAFEELMEEKLFQPLKLNSAGYGSPAAKDPISQPHGHSKNDSYTAIRQDMPDFIAPMGNVAINIDDWSKFILFHLKAYQGTNKSLLESTTLDRMHMPPNSAVWDWVSQLSFFSSWFLKVFYNLDVSTLNYASGWCTQKKNDGNYLLLHDGQGSSFTARVQADPITKNAILLVTNAKVDHLHLLKAAKAIKKHYASQANLPIINIP
jgi:CubicO group peptidase (beta-lactamase class C family)